MCKLKEISQNTCKDTYKKYICINKKRESAPEDLFLTLLHVICDIYCVWYIWSGTPNI